MVFLLRRKVDTGADTGHRESSLARVRKIGVQTVDFADGTIFEEYSGVLNRRKETCPAAAQTMLKEGESGCIIVRQGE